jgi:hypothetical protein
VREAHHVSRLHIDRIEVQHDGGVLVFVLVDEHAEVPAELCQVPRDNQDERAATIRVRKRRG